MECVDAGIVPSVGSVQQCKNRARIDAMSALAGIAPPEAPADQLACCFGAPGIEACEYA
jgi:hypothetical protein